VRGYIKIYGNSLFYINDFADLAAEAGGIDKILLLTRPSLSPGLGVWWGWMHTIKLPLYDHSFPTVYDRGVDIESKRSGFPAHFCWIGKIQEGWEDLLYHIVKAIIVFLAMLLSSYCAKVKAYTGIFL
jgi:hypothetical protein